jgi:hypothetical protein
MDALGRSTARAEVLVNSPIIRRPRISLLAALAPAIFVVHFLEEGHRFVPWFNARVARGITPGLFWTVNLTGLVITTLLAATVWAAPSAGSGVATFAWLSFLFAANALFHITAAVVDRDYMPGLVTAVVLYVPFYLAFGRELLRGERVRVSTLAAVGALCATPMLVHGYLIVFRGSRLF